jgi:methionyl-tRNA formyltransferase
MRIVFLGSGDFGLPTLDWLDARYELVGIVTQPDKPAGRKRRLTPTAVGQWALQRGRHLIKTEDCNDPELVRQVQDLKPEAGIVIAFGQKLGPELVGSLGRLAVNLHGSLLPKFRGAAPINRAVMEGERQTGVSVIELAQRMDAGRILAQASLQIGTKETAGEVHDRLAQLGPEAIGKVLSDLESGHLEPLPQDENQASRAPKLKKRDGTVDFNQPAWRVRARINGLTPWPGCRINWHSQQTGQSQQLTLLRASEAAPSGGGPSHAAPGTVLGEGQVAAADGAVELLEVRAPGGKPLSMADFARGRPFAAGDTLTPIRPES